MIERFQWIISNIATANNISAFHLKIVKISFYYFFFLVYNIFIYVWIFKMFDDLYKAEDKIETRSREFLHIYFSTIDALNKSDNLEFYPYCLKTRDTNISTYRIEKVIEYFPKKVEYNVTITCTEVGDPWEDFEEETHSIRDIPIDLYINGSKEDIIEYTTKLFEDEINRKMFMEVRDKYSPIMYMDPDLVIAIANKVKEYDRISYKEVSEILKHVNLIDDNEKVK